MKYFTTIILALNAYKHPQVEKNSTQKPKIKPHKKRVTAIILTFFG